MLLISNIRHYVPYAMACETLNFYPHLVVIGTTGVFSRFPKYSGAYRKIESLMKSYKSTLFLVRYNDIWINIRQKY